ncbi:DUF6538 domain-containing protein [Pseudoxanthomonas sp. GW2]|uniref:DUF6538 domain-containing protein n=1 Tax=Pseudoxanthomonas sp. GW2 TaxID=1211114 RepID=UPI0012EAC1C9|nr:DUF6538 domain-containing protein [Pseudoxanthomonas sp. GW2]
MAENLVQRNGVFYARVQAPKELQELRRHLGVIGRKDIWKSLCTKDRAEAKRRLPHVLIDIERQFATETAELKAQGAQRLIEPSEAELESAARAFVEAELRQDELERAHRPSARQAEAARQAFLRRLQEHPPKSKLDLIARSLDLRDPAAMGELSAEKRQVLKEELRQSLGSERVRRHRLGRAGFRPRTCLANRAGLGGP